MFASVDGRNMASVRIRRKMIVRLLSMIVLLFITIFPILTINGIFKLLSEKDHFGEIYLRWKGMKLVSKEGLVFQDQNNNCGPAAVKTALDVLGIESSMEDIEKESGTNRFGTSMLGLKRAIEGYGLRAEGWRLTWRDFYRIKLPAVLFIEGQHYVTALQFIGEDSLIIADPSIGRVKMSKNGLLKIWKGETLVLKR